MPVVPTYQPVQHHAGQREKVTTAASGTNIPNYGLTVLTSTSVTHYTIDNPVEGVHKYIVMAPLTAASTKALSISSASTAVTINGSTSNTMTFDADGEAVVLIGRSTSAWTIASNTGGVTLTASTGA